MPIPPETSTISLNEFVEDPDILEPLFVVAL